MSKKKQILLICIFLAAATLIAFWQVSRCDFLSYDDPRYVTENGPVQGGLTLEGIRWAFTTLYAEFWHPLTWLSHMLDVQLFGLEPRGHHLTNLLFHLANTLLLFLVFHRMTKELWQSAFVAALFALHPLHVESVAWVAERKDVLSAFFWMLTMGAYVHYVELPGLKRYLAVLLFFVLGLMAKPMLVTLPFALLLLDYWPLQRLAQKKSPQKIRTKGNKPGTDDKKKGKSRKKHPVERPEKTAPPDHSETWALIRPLLWEKIPLFALAALASALAYVAQHQEGEAGLMEGFPLSDRIANAFISYILYIGKTIWPANLGVFYPYPGVRALWQVWGAVLLFIAVTFLIIRTAKRFPYFAFGWLWYVGTLLPVIGIVEVGDHAMADRYTYIPLIGLFIMAAWGVPELLKGWRYKKEALYVSSALSLPCLLIVTWTQVGYWRNSITLFEHTFKVTEPNSITYVNRGIAYQRGGNFQRAIEDLSKAIELNPEYATAYNTRASIHASLGSYKQAIEDVNKAIELYPKYAKAYHTRAGIYVSLGSYKQAVEDCDKAIELNPKYAMAYNNRANVHVNLGNYKQAIEDSGKAIELNPQYAEAYHNRANAYARLGNYRQAIQDYDQALEINPKYAVAYNNRAGVYESLGNYRRAIEDYAKALEMDPKYAVAYNNRGNAYGSVGNFQQAIEDISKAIELNPKYAAAYNNRAGVYGSQGNYKQAIVDCDKAIELSPKYAEAYNNRGNAYARLGHYRQAIEDYAKALEMNPKYAVAYNNRAAAYWGRGYHEKAIADLKTAARLGYEPAQKSLKSQGIGW